MFGSPWLFVIGLALLAMGFAMATWASNRNLKEVAIGAALGAAWTLLWKRQRPGVPKEVTSRLDELRAQELHLGKAKVVTGYAAKHVASLAVGIASLAVLVSGAILVALGIFWH